MIDTDMEAAEGWKRILAQEMKAADLKFDPNKVRSRSESLLYIN